MTDPAIEAAQRAVAAFAISALIGPGRYALMGAREALAPIRQLHRKVPQYLDCDYAASVTHDICDTAFEDVNGEWCCPTCTGNQVWHVCSECRNDDGARTSWPCATALLCCPERGAMSGRIASLCSGYGGLDLAVADFFDADIAWHCEYDAAPSKILAHHWPAVPNHHNVRDLALRMTLGDTSIDQNIDILTAGYPCQPTEQAT